MKTKFIFGLIFAIAILASIIAGLLPRTQRVPPDLPPGEAHEVLTSPDATSTSIISKDLPSGPVTAPLVNEITVAPLLMEPARTNKLERIRQIQETFRALAAGDPITALRTAKQITDETERETALLTLVTEWTQGELGSPRQRARAIATYGLETGLAFELAHHPALAVLWANELIDGNGRVAVLQQVANATVGSDPTAAFALSEQLPPADRRSFIGALFADWGGTDTDSAMKWADQLPDSAERDAAIQAIRTAAPVGIGAVLQMQDGYAVINQLLPGTPAELSGQIHPGDRILALAQGDNSFVAANGLPLQQVVQMVRGAPNTPLQLQILASDAPPNSVPRTITIFRDQLKFKP